MQDFGVLILGEVLVLAPSTLRDLSKPTPHPKLERIMTRSMNDRHNLELSAKALKEGRNSGFDASLRNFLPSEC